MTDWQPIETAPKDGACVLGYCPPHVEMVLWHYRRKGWRIVNAWTDFDNVSPTHWMPLPEPPK